MRDLLLGAMLLLLASCQGGFDDKRPLVPLDEPFFRCRVQPILTKNCAAQACHGDGLRYLRLYARSRLRLSGTEEMRNAALSEAERAHNFDAARAYVDLTSVDDSLLLKKPLMPEAGGYHHPAFELFRGLNVWDSAKEPEYVVLLDWVRGKKEDPACIEPGSDL